MAATFLVNKINAIDRGVKGLTEQVHIYVFFKGLNY